MSRVMLTAALVLGSATLVAGSARAATECLGCYITEAAAEKVAFVVLRDNPEARCSIKYLSEDPRDGSPLAGYYLLVAYPGLRYPLLPVSPPPPPQEGEEPSGILHPGDQIPIRDNVNVPYPGTDDPDDPDDDDGMGP